MDAALLTAITALVASTPNLVIAVWTIIQQDRRIDSLLAQQRWMLEQLMALHPPQDFERDPAIVLKPIIAHIPIE